jgi:hypothetical protein
MKKQTFDNHIRWYPSHHFVLYPVLLLCTAGSIICLLRYPQDAAIWISITAVFLLIGWLSFMVRQHYALYNQNRIVRLEMRLRYYQLTQKRFEEVEDKLTFGQVAALRFASDEELPVLIQKAISENLSPGSIKRSVQNWQSDTMRV